LGCDRRCPDHCDLSWVGIVQPGIVNLVAYYGDDWSQTFGLKEDTVPVDLTGHTILSEALSPDGVYHTLEAAITTPTQGQIQLSIPSGQGPPPDTYKYDIQTTDSMGKIKTWIRGRLLVKEDITR
jgi:hypothetical protein